MRGSASDALCRCTALLAETPAHLGIKETSIPTQAVALVPVLQGAHPATSVRLRLSTGRDYQDLYVFKNVSILGLTGTFGWSAGSIAYSVRQHSPVQLSPCKTAFYPAGGLAIEGLDI